MAQFQGNAFELSDIHGGVRFENGDIVDASVINAVVEASYFAQEKAKEVPKTEDVINAVLAEFPIAEEASF